MPDGEFMAQLAAMVTEEPVLSATAADVADYFIRKVKERIHTLAPSWARLVAKVELDAFKQHLRLEATTIENKDRLASRSKLLQDLRKILVHDGSLR